MSRQKKQKPLDKENKNTSFIQFIIIAVLLSLIGIGDLIKFLLKFIWRTFLRTYTFIFKVLHQSYELIHKLIFENKVEKNIISYFSNQLKKTQTRFEKLLSRQNKIVTPANTTETLIIKPTTRAWSAWEAFRFFISGVVLTLLFILLPYQTYIWLSNLPNPNLLTNRDIQVTTKIYDRNDKLLYEIYTDQNRTPVKLAELPRYLLQATVAIEDREFYLHNGFSVKGMIRAVKETIFNKNIQGGSTITQQLIKSALLSPEIKLSRKIKEIILAFWAERLFSKNQILEMYLNQVPYGGTSWGVEAASLTYFGKSAKDLSLAESALVAGLPQAPSEYSPFGNSPEKAIERQHMVLDAMANDKYITNLEANEAKGEKLNFIKQRNPIRAAHFVMYIKELLEEKYGPRVVEQGGLRIKTSLDIDIQEKVEEIVKRNIDSLKNLNVGNGAVLVTNPKTGEILAMVGSRDYFDIEAEGNVNVTTSLRQPGSSIKVVNYAAALENGYTAATIIDDSPIVYNIPGSAPYAPQNYDGKFHGPVPFRYALANSYNIPAVKILNKIGVSTMVEKGRLMGITSWNDASRFGLSLTLGAGEVNMLDMAKVYGTIANSGKRVDLQPISEINDYTGRVIEANAAKTGIQAIKPEVSYILANILADNIARTGAFGPNSKLVIPGKTVSVKTGTSNDKRDNWTIGFTPSVVVTVWVGNNDNSPMNQYLASGVTGAAPIWNEVMNYLLASRLDETFQVPPGITTVPCYFGRVEYFMSGTEPKDGRCQQLPTPTITPTP